jgi:hypothetical protein
METHTRFQADGIHLLLQHYDSCNNGAFLEAACAAADYLIGIADTFSDGSTWYLHDTLELSEDPSRAGYPSKQRSRAFGKSLSNTLCLNTHAWTLTALLRLTEACRDERKQMYENASARGLHALHAVLSTTTGATVYAALYATRDLCLRWNTRTGIAFPLRVCDAALRRILRRLKPRLPRLAMPNGYIERDLERSTLADRYIPVNLKDLALLSRRTRCEWIRPLVKRGLSHWIQSGLWQRELSHSTTAQHALDAALLLAVDDDDCHDLARRIYADIHAAGRAITVDAVAGAAGYDDWTVSRFMPDAIPYALPHAESGD